MTGIRGGVRSVVRTAAIGAVGGALVGAAIEALNDLLPGGLAFASLVDIWPPVLAVAGFLGGFVVATVLAVARALRTR